MPRKDPEARRAYQREYGRRRRAAKQSDPEWAAKQRAYYERWVAKPGVLEARREYARENQRRYRAKPGMKEELAAKARERRTPEERLRLQCLRHGITVERYHEILLSQGGSCVCGATSRLHIDHDHTHCDRYGCAECVRGIVCGPCNRAMGVLKDDPARLRVLADYLEAAAR